MAVAQYDADTQTGSYHGLLQRISITIGFSTDLDSRHGDGGGQREVVIEENGGEDVDQAAGRGAGPFDQIGGEVTGFSGRPALLERVPVR